MLDEEKKFQDEDEVKLEDEAETPTADAPDEDESVPELDADESSEDDDMPDFSFLDEEDEEDFEEDNPFDVEDEEPAEKMFTQSQVNDIVGRVRQEGRDSAMKDLYGRYGVSNDDELNDIFGRGQIYDNLNDDFMAQGDAYKKVMAENALLKSHVDESRWDDIKLILGGKGLDISQENIESLLPSHPEWRGNGVQPIENEMGGQPLKPFSPEMGEQFANTPTYSAPEKPAVLRKLGNDVGPSDNQPGETEEDRVRRLYGM